MLFRRFQQESNRIEGILAVSEDEVLALRRFVDLTNPDVSDVEKYVDVCQPGALLRALPGQNVRVGNYIAPDGGPRIVYALSSLLTSLRSETPWKLHCDYESLHPFTDCNGRSGRALWLWCMLRGTRWERDAALGLGFLHTFYYQTLQRTQR